MVLRVRVGGFFFLVLVGWVLWVGLFVGGLVLLLWGGFSVVCWGLFVGVFGLGCLVVFWV